MPDSLDEPFLRSRSVSRTSSSLGGGGGGGGGFIDELDLPSSFQPREVNRSSRASSFAEDLDVDSSGFALSRGTKVAFAMPEMALSALDTVASSLLSNYYVNSLGVGTAYLSIAVFLAGMLRTLSTLAAGSVCDRTRTRWGRRKPWLAGLSLPFALSVLLLLFPPDVSGGAAAAWFLIVYAPLNSMWGVLNVSYRAFTTEIAQTNRSRAGLEAYLGIFAGLGVVLVTVLESLFSPTAGMRVIGVTVSVFVVASLAGVCMWVRENALFCKSRPMNLVPGIRSCLRNEQFKSILLAGLGFSVINEIFGLFAFLLSAVLDFELDDVNAGVAVLLTVFSIASLITIPITYRLLRRYGQITTYRIALGLLVAYGLIGWAALDVFKSYGMLVFAMAVLSASCGMGSYAGSVLGSDVIDYDELHTGKRREATYAGVDDVPSEFFLVAGRALPLLLLDVTGYVSGSKEQNHATTQFLIYFPTLLALPAAAMGFYFLKDYGITKEKHLKVLMAIERRRDGEEGVRDPVTGEVLPPLENKAPVELGQEEGREDEGEGGDDEWVLYFSAVELRAMENQSKQGFLAQYALTTLAYAAYSAVLLTRGVQLILARQVDSCSVVVLFACVALILFFYELLRWRGVRWFLNATPAVFAFAVSEHVRLATGATARTFGGDQWAARRPYLYSFLFHVACAGAVYGLWQVGS